MDTKTSTIKTIKIAYKIGFSSSLSSDSWSGYNELSKWRFEGESRLLRLLRKAFLRGYVEGSEAKKEFYKKDLVANL